MPIIKNKPIVIASVEVLLALVFSLQIMIINGVYLADVILLAIIVFGFIFNKKQEKKLINGEKLFLASMIFLAVLICIIVVFQFLIKPVEFTLDSFLYPIKFCMFVIYYWYFRTSANFEFYGNAVGAALLIPFLVSAAAFFDDHSRNIMQSIWRYEGYQGPFRFGGIFGADVNSFGMYASLTLLYFIFAWKKQNNFLNLFGAALIFLCIIISGMRAGVLAIGISFMLTVVISKDFRKVYFGKLVLLGGAFSLGAIAFIMVIDQNYFESEKLSFLQEVLKRISYEEIFKELDGGDSSNLNQALGYLSDKRNEFQRVSSDFDYIIGLSSQFGYVDSMYIDMYYRYGLIATMLFICILLSLLQSSSYLIKVLVLFTVVVSIKGIFPLANFYIFLVCLMAVQKPIQELVPYPCDSVKNFCPERSS